jgi:cytochrome c oxidase assembly factor CtaG
MTGAATHAPQLLTLPLTHWRGAWGLDGAAALALGLYAWGVRRCRTWPAARSAAFAGGVACALVALQSGIDAFDDRLLSVHMVQHMLLLLLVPLLLLAGRPQTLALRALAPRRRRSLARALVSLRALSSPYVGLSIFSVVLLAWHVPALYEATLSHPLLHELEHALLLLAGLSFWSPLLDADPLASRRIGGLGRIAYLLAAMPSMALLGAYLNRAATLVYPAYRAPARALGVSAIADQQQAAAIMWVGGGFFIAVVGLWIAMSAISAEERRQRAREHHALGAQAIDGATLGPGP